MKKVILTTIILTFAIMMFGMTISGLTSLRYSIKNTKFNATTLDTFDDYFFDHIEESNGDMIKEKSEVRFSEVFDFEWDYLLVYDTYAKQDEINETLGFSYTVETDLSNGILFVLNDKVVNHLALTMAVDPIEQIQLIVLSDEDVFLLDKGSKCSLEIFRSYNSEDSYYSIYVSN